MGKVIELKDADFETVVIQSSIPVLVDFWSPSCIPCRTVAPILEKLAEEYDGEVAFAKVNIFENMVVAGRLNVMSLPTLIIYNQGQPVERLAGIQSKETLAELLDQYLA